jgi:hypothetical protein
VYNDKKMMMCKKKDMCIMVSVQKVNNNYAKKYRYTQKDIDKKDTR